MAAFRALARVMSTPRRRFFRAACYAIDTNTPAAATIFADARLALMLPPVVNGAAAPDKAPRRYATALLPLMPADVLICLMPDAMPTLPPMPAAAVSADAAIIVEAVMVVFFRYACRLRLLPPCWIDATTSCRRA